MIDRSPSETPQDFELETRDWHPDEQLDEAGEHNTHFTEAQANSLQEYIWTIRNMLGLRHWDIFLASVAAKETTNASIHAVYGRHVAALAVNKNWWSYSREVQRNTILHEVLHIVHNAQTEVIRTSKQLNAVWVTFERETELMVDHLANSLEDMFPLPEIPKLEAVKDGK